MPSRKPEPTSPPERAPEPPKSSPARAGEAAHVERAAAATAEQARMSRYAADASLRRARKVLRKAASEAERTLAGARREAERLQSLAGRIRAFLDGLRKSSIEHRVRRSFEAALMRAERRAAEANRRLPPRPGNVAPPRKRDTVPKLPPPPLDANETSRAAALPLSCCLRIVGSGSDHSRE